MARRSRTGMAPVLVAVRIWFVIKLSQAWASVGDWVFDGDKRPIPAEANEPGGGYRLINVGVDRGILVAPDGSTAAIRRAESLPVAGAHDPSPKLSAALEAAARARLSQRALCPADADAGLCEAWCKAVAPMGMQLTGRVQGGRCGEAQSKPECVCTAEGSPDASPIATCLSPCGAKAQASKAQKQSAADSQHDDGTGAVSSKPSKAERPAEEAGQASVKPSSDVALAISDLKSSRFLLYDTSYGISFGKQLEVFLAVRDIVADLNSAIAGRCKGAGGDACRPWTLVLPPWCEVIHWYAEATAMLWRELFDTNSTGKEVPTVEYQDFRRSIPAAVDLAALPTYAPHQQGSGGKGGFAGFGQRPHDCEHASGGQQKIPHSRSASNGRRWLVYSGYCDGDILVTDFRCAFLRQASKAAVIDLIGRAKPKDQVVLLKHVDAVGLPVPPSAAQGHLRPSSSLARIAARFSTRTLGKLPYLAVHVRRNEFVQTHPESTPSAVAAAARLNHLLKTLHLEQVFVYTDARQDYRDELRSLVKAPLYYFAEDDGAPNLEHAGKEAIVCLRILAEGKIFIGTSNSAFSAAVRRERDHVGRETSTAEVFCNNFSVEGAKTRCT